MPDKQVKGESMKKIGRVEYGHPMACDNVAREKINEIIESHNFTIEDKPSAVEDELEEVIRRQADTKGPIVTDEDYTALASAMRKWIKVKIGGTISWRGKLEGATIKVSSLHDALGLDKE